MSTLGEDLPKEMARVRDHVLPHYVELGPVGAFGAHFIRADLAAAVQALAEGDVAEMIRVYKALKDTQS